MSSALLSGLIFVCYDNEAALLKVEQTGDIISVIGHMHKSAIGIFEPNKCSSNIY